MARAEIERLRRFGEPRHYDVDEALVRIGEAGHGLTLIVSGKVTVTGHDALGRGATIVTYGAGKFLGELAQLTGRPSLVDVHAVKPVEAVTIAPERLRALLVEEAELGESDHAGVDPAPRPDLQTPGVGVIVIGRPDHRDVLRLRGFRPATASRTETSIPRPIRVRALIERFHVDPRPGC